MKIKFGCVYRRKDKITHTYLDDQHYDYYIPVCYVNKDGKECWRMVDTYMVHRDTYRGSNTLEQRKKFLLEANKGDTSQEIYNGPYNFCYQNYYDLQSDELDDNKWEEYMDINDCSAILSNHSVDEYDESDVYKNVPLYWEDSVNWNDGIVGANYLKKGKEKSAKCLAAKYRKRLLNKIYLSNLNWEKSEYYDKLKEIVETGILQGDDKRKALITLEEFDAYIKFETELQNKYDEIEQKYSSEKSE